LAAKIERIARVGNKEFDPLAPHVESSTFETDQSVRFLYIQRAENQLFAIGSILFEAQ
jgi:hypothetical protein